MSDHENDTPAAAPTLAELNAHLFAAILPETHALPERADGAEPTTKKPAGKGKAAAPTTDE